MQSLNAGWSLYLPLLPCGRLNHLSLFHVFTHYSIAGMALYARLGAVLECSNKAFVFEEKKTLEMWPAGLCKRSTREVNKQRLYFPNLRICRLCFLSFLKGVSLAGLTVI